MEFHEKLQELRKQKGLTQEQLAERLYVSRTAVSKWESGRGYPTIDSLKQIATLFSVTVDQLLSGEELLSVAECDGRDKQKRLRDLVFGLLDISLLLFLFLPFFGQQRQGVTQAVSLLSLTEVTPYIKTAYFFIVVGLALWGVCVLALQHCQGALWNRLTYVVSFCLNAVGVLLFVVSPQPYAAAFLFVFLLIKALVFIKK